MGTRGFIVAVLVIFATLLFLANRRGIITDTFMTRLANVATIASLLLAVIVLFLPNNDQTAAPTARVPETTLVPSQPISTASSTVANTPTFTPVPPTPTFTPSPSPKQTSTPTPKPGDVLYQADWSTGMD